MKKIKIYTDGACKKNPGNGGWAFVWVDENDVVINRGSGFIPETTNQKMEMVAVIESLKNINKGTDVSIHSDSAYVVNCFKDDWIGGWIKKNWVNSAKKPVANKELWEEMKYLVDNIENVSFVKVKGHDDDQFNIMVDKMASDVAKRFN